MPEFFAVRTVAEALDGFRPARRTSAERVPLEVAAGRVPAAPVRAPAALPGFARATVDGYAVRAADTYGASDGLPAYLDVIGSVRMGAPPAAAVTAGRAVAIPTGGVLPEGADAVVMIEHTEVAGGAGGGSGRAGGSPAGHAGTTIEHTEVPGGAVEASGRAGAGPAVHAATTIEVTRPAAPGEGLVRADEDAVPGAVLAPAGRPLRAQDVGMLAAAGVTEVEVHRRPRVAIVSTGDEVVPGATAEPRPGQVRDAIAPALAALAGEAGGEPDARGIVADDAGALRDVLSAAVAECDVVVVSAGSSVGTRDETAAVVAGLGEPGVFCHGLALKPGKPTLLAECAGVPLIGLPGNPRSALVVFRLVGMPVVRRTGGWTESPHEPAVRARLDRDLPSQAGRLDVVQVSLRDGAATPLFGSSALLSILTAADGYLTVPEAATGLPAGSQVEVTLYR